MSARSRSATNVSGEGRVSGAAASRPVPAAPVVPGVSAGRAPAGRAVDAQLVPGVLGETVAAPAGAGAGVTAVAGCLADPHNSVMAAALEYTSMELLIAGPRWRVYPAAPSAAGSWGSPTIGIRRGPPPRLRSGRRPWRPWPWLRPPLR